MLHLVQSVEGRITPEGIEACAEILDISAAEVSGVATFYTMYKRKPVGDYLVGVCTNTLCAVMGGDAIFERLKDHLDVGNDETTEDAGGKITLEHVECNAACDYAPVMMVNWEFMDNMTPASAVQLVDDLREGKEVTLHPRPPALHLAGGRAGARRLPRRPRRRGAGRRSRVAGRAGPRPGARLDRAQPRPSAADDSKSLAEAPLEPEQAGCGRAGRHRARRDRDQARKRARRMGLTPSPRSSPTSGTPSGPGSCRPTRTAAATAR